MKIRQPPGIIVMMLLCLLMVISAGCIGADYVANRDIVVIRLDPEGTPAWTRIIDTGYDDSARDLVETRDGGLLIAGGRTNQRIGVPSPRLVRLSREGTVLWDRVPGNESGELSAVALAPGGDYATVSYDGRIWRLDPDGNVRWSRSSGMERGMAVIATADGGFVVAGEQSGRIPFGTVVVYNTDGTVSSRPPFPNESVMTPGCSETSLPVGPDRTVMVTQCTVPYRIVGQGTVVKLGSDGNVSWKRSYGAESLQSVWSVLEDRENGGYLVSGFREEGAGEVNTTAYLSAMRIDRNGTSEWVTPIDQIVSYTPPLLRPAPDGYDLLYIHTTLEDEDYGNRPALVHLWPNGSADTPRIIDTGVIDTWTGDGGYFFAGFPLPGRLGYSEAIFGRHDCSAIHAVRLAPDGTLLWDREIRGVAINYGEKVIQTTDGGFVILAMRENA